MGRALLQALRHRWDGYRRFKPSLELPTSYGSLKDDTPDNAWGRSVYPFSVLPDALLSVGDAFAARTPPRAPTPDEQAGPQAGLVLCATPACGPRPLDSRLTSSSP